MNLGRVKTFLIVLFLGINIYLVFSHFMSTRFFTDSKTIDRTLDIIQNYSITADKDVVPRYVTNLRNIDTTNIIYTKKFKSLTEDKVFTVSGDSFAGELSSPTVTDSDRKIKKQIKEFLKDAGFSARNMKIGDIRTKDGKAKTFDIYCKVKGYTVFDSVINIKVTKDKTTISGKWFEPTTGDVRPVSRTRQSVYVTSILIDLAQNEDAIKNAPFKIKKIEHGYLSGSLYEGGGHVSTTARPFYKLTDNKGNTYYYDARDGTYFKQEEK